MLDLYRLSHLTVIRRIKKSLAVLLVLVLAAAPALSGITITATNGIVMTGADGIVMTGADGIVMTGADGFLNSDTNGIVMTGADGIVMTGADGFAYPNSVRLTNADGVDITRADGIVMTGADGIVMTGADGTTYYSDSVTVSLPNGIVMTGADGIVMTGADGIVMTGADAFTANGADGIVMTGADGIVMTGADAVHCLGPDGLLVPVNPDGLTFTGVTGIVMTGADGIVMTGADGIVMTGADGVVVPSAGSEASGLLSVDPELALLLNTITDDSNVNAVVVYHHLPTDADIEALHSLGILGGTRFRVLPMVVITGTRSQIIAVSRLSGVRSIYGNRTLTLNSEPEVRASTGVDRAWADQEIRGTLQNLPVAGRNVTVAVLDTGIDSQHQDLAGRVTKNIKVLDLQSVGVGFSYPINSDNLANTDLLYGHGSFVAGIIAGSGERSTGRYAGVAPESRVVGVSAGDLTLPYILSGFDYLLANHQTLGIRVLNCSFSANTVFDFNDPVNVATRMLTNAGINVVFSAGNTGPGADSLNPYAIAPWVVSVGATDSEGRLADFSSRGHFSSGLFKPTLVAPGVRVVSLRGTGIVNVASVEGLLGGDAQKLTAGEMPYYTVASGTSFSAPQVAGTIALMLEANPNLSPAEVREILQRTATPLAPYYAHEVGAGMLNAHAAVLQAAFTSRDIGTWRGTLDRGQVSFFNDPLVTFSGSVHPLTGYNSYLNIPSHTLVSSIHVGWGPLGSTNDLGIYAYDSADTKRGESNTLNLAGLNGRRERISLTLPSAGSWRLNIRNTLGLLGSTQQFSGVMEIGRARYANMTDLGALSSGLTDDIYQSLRTFSMWPIGSKFRPEGAVSRSDLATTLTMGARVPQYLAGAPMFIDVRGSSRIFVESVQSLPAGPLFPNVSPGGQFWPNQAVTRLEAAVALVRVAGLGAEAEANQGAPLSFLDAASIPAELHGYVRVATSNGLIQSGPNFDPQSAFTRADLARAVVAIQRRAVQ